MTNTINNVPRELLNIAALHLEYSGYTETGKKLRTLLDAAPSPAGVDGLEVETYLHTMHMELGRTEQFCSKWKGDPFGVSGVDYSSTYSVTSEPLCRLSAAQAIIDGLRGELIEERAKVAQLEEGIPRIMEASYQFRQQRDQQAQRIGELEGLLRDVRGLIEQSSMVYRHNSTTVTLYRIDAALSAGKEGE